MDVLTEEPRSSFVVTRAASSAVPRRLGLDQPVVVAMLLLALALVGGAVGGVVGLGAPREYQVRQAAQIDHVLIFPVWESNQATARLAQTVQRADVQEAAATAAGLPVSTYREIAATGQQGSPIVDVEIVVDDPDVGPAAISALIDAAVLTLAENDLVPARLIVDGRGPALAEADAQLAALWTRADLAPGTDLGDVYNDARSELVYKRTELGVAKEQWRIIQLTADIGVLEERLARISPLVEQWYEVENRRDDLADLVTPARQRIEELTLGQEVVAEHGYQGPATVSELSRLSVVGRFTAAGAAIGLALALALMAGAHLRTLRRVS